MYYYTNIIYCPVQVSCPPHPKDLLSGFLAVMSVNLVIAYYIFMVMKERQSQGPARSHLKLNPALACLLPLELNDDNGDARAPMKAG